MIVSMRESGLATNSISSYVRVFKTFMNWSRQQGYTTLTVPNYKQVETVKETYTDEELLLLLEKPKANGTFCEYRNWVIVNFLLNSGCRASTVRATYRTETLIYPVAELYSGIRRRKGSGRPAV